MRRLRRWMLSARELLAELGRMLGRAIHDALVHADYNAGKRKR